MRRNDWLVGQLPMGMLDDGFFTRFVSLFQEVAGSLMDGADNIANVVDATVAPPEVVRWLGSWIGLHAIDGSLDEELQRRLVRESSKALAWRGTRAGLERYLTAVTGAPVEVDEGGGIFREGEANQRPPWVDVRVSSTGWLAEPELVTLVADEVPANVMLEVWLDDRQLWPVGTAGSPGPVGLPGEGDPTGAPGGPDSSGTSAADGARGVPSALGPPGVPGPGGAAPAEHLAPGETGAMDAHGSPGAAGDPGGPDLGATDPGGPGPGGPGPGGPGPGGPGPGGNGRGPRPGGEAP